jgi:methylthioxylose transferase
MAVGSRSRRTHGRRLRGRRFEVHPLVPRTAVPLILWTVLVITARWVGLGLIHRDPRAALAFPPLAARFDPRLDWRVVIPAAVAWILVLASPRMARTMRWRALLIVAFAAAAAWAVALAQIDGVPGLTGDANYLQDVLSIRSPGTFLSGFLVHIDQYTQHVQAHPPGFILLLWVLRRVGLGGFGWEAVVVIAGGAAAVAAAMITVRETAGEEAGRAAAPFLIVAPAAIWVATTADAFYMGVTAWSVALIVLATGREGKRSDGLALGGGLLFGAALFLSYGLILVALVPAVVILARRRFRPVMIAGAGVAVVAAVFAVAGFWWLDGLRATLVQYHAGVAQFRPQNRFALINLGAFALALGPAAGVAIARLRDRRLWMLVGAALIAVALADLSGLSKAEVERIWLPFAPWILVAGASLGGDRPMSRPWLGLQAAACLLMQLTIRGP